MTPEQIKDQISQIISKIQNKEKFDPVVLSETEENRELVENICVELGLITQKQCIGWNLAQTELFLINSDPGSFIIVKLISEK